MHTPGPWRVLPEEADKDYLRVRGTRLGDRYKIANVHAMERVAGDGPAGRVRAVTHANARLIAHAPELHASLRKLLAEYEETLSSEFGGTRYCQQALAELQPYRDLLAAVEGGAA